MTASPAIMRRSWKDIQATSLAAVIGGQVRQAPNGKAVVVQGLNNAGMIAGALVNQRPADIYELPKVGSTVLLAGGDAYWSLANNYVTFKRLGNQDPWLGTLDADAKSGDATCFVNFGFDGRPTVDIKRDPFASVIIGTQAIGTMGLNLRSGLDMILAATNEAEKVDALSSDAIALSAGVTGAILEGNFTVVADDSATNAIFSLGLASATHATAFTSIANSIGFQVKNHDLKIYAESVAATGVTVAPTDTTKVYAVGTPVEVWVDLRVPAAPVLYVNGVRVLSATVFDVSAYTTGAWYLLAHLVKTATTDTMEVLVNKLRVRTLSM